MPLLTLTSDIGQQDFLIGAVKGQLLQTNPAFSLIDITHNLSPFNYPQSAYVCRNAIKNFPPGTFHLILVNLFDEKPEHLLMAEHNGHFIGCADNGLLTMILEEVPQKTVALALDKNQQKNTLYCASVFAHAFNKLLTGKKIEDIGDAGVSIHVKNPLRPMLGNDYIEGQIIFIDNFENVIVNIHQDEFEEQRKGRSFKIVFKRDEVIDKISETYADAPEGEKLALFNAAGYLEIAINKGNAAGLLGLQGFSEKQLQQSQYMNSRLFYQTVKVYFE
ncbi:MAG: SAM-dependent chlorinase/fluorinase [Chitinophagaceae bacterium]|nr:SAM-dependent chlorinase/fluorinase [Chitinophagaceae bacterium]MBK8786824.1 SAM-dependent chlorinase/fluorinase [Chitinophagaceae bacterium]MBK9486881.1 SAM-dependent chlorinase/fluorinase [Chitinophagaceae bacterium]MBL0202558.1 SAM-dependent chlorinase/fluorinase [Chitinophagaceae bacterium]